MNETNSRGGKVEIALRIDKLFILGKGEWMDREVVEKMDRVCIEVVDRGCIYKGQRLQRERKEAVERMRDCRDRCCTHDEQLRSRTSLDEVV